MELHCGCVLMNCGLILRFNNITNHQYETKYQMGFWTSLGFLLLLLLITPNSEICLIFCCICQVRDFTVQVTFVTTH